jgi:hypothetical protein
MLKEKGKKQQRKRTQKKGKQKTTKGSLFCAIIHTYFKMLEPYAVKAARTVLRGGKIERSYLSQFDTQVPLTVNDEW